MGVRSPPITMPSPSRLSMPPLWYEVAIMSGCEGCAGCGMTPMARDTMALAPPYAAVAAVAEGRQAGGVC